MDKAASWQSLAGTFLHRAVLHPGGKWRNVKRPEDREEYISHSMRLARQLHHALRDENYYTAEALCDRGGPSWCLSIDQYRTLPPSDMMRAIDPLLVATEPIVRGILDRAATEGWKQVRTEVDDPLARLAGRKNGRLDLLADRGSDRHPLVVELKTTPRRAPLPRQHEEAMSSTEPYAQAVAQGCHRDVEYLCVWGHMAGRGCTWSDARTVSFKMPELKNPS
ncbi:hypothetical protein ACNHUS_35485 [Actinomycetes bacterium M1A6_2h]